MGVFERQTEYGIIGSVVFNHLAYTNGELIKNEYVGHNWMYDELNDKGSFFFF